LIATSECTFSKHRFGEAVCLAPGFCDGFVMTPMKQRNTVISSRFLGIGMLIAVGLLVTGCGQGVRKPQPAVSPQKAALTGIPACDSYLDSYLACHRAAGTYAADTLQTHYQAMRDTLLQQASDPGVRPYLANRCMGLAQQLQASLQGRACTSPGAPNTASSH
jgi:hypothetical protein